MILLILLYKLSLDARKYGHTALNAELKSAQGSLAYKQTFIQSTENEQLASSLSLQVL